MKKYKKVTENQVVKKYYEIQCNFIYTRYTCTLYKSICVN